ncbi:MerR family DNA-binding protein [Micromonospora sp. HM5-17]|uniref:MerR family DNA-binding protein n=1 Tax=Micromonospora sp. HM5-17 TaxID=2487710 RepID=UPI0018F6CFE0|nr:MerR family DNA-binding protein [Micromonospora sp. HM5-17]
MDAPAGVAHIRSLLAAGLPTSVIRELLPCVRGPGPALEHCAAPTLRKWLHELDGRIAALQQARSAPTHLLAAIAGAEA